MTDKITDPNDPRLGGGSLVAKLEHQTAQRAAAEERAEGLEAQLRKSGDRFRETIRGLNARIDELEKERDELHRALVGSGTAPVTTSPATPEATTPATCVVELCENWAWSNGYCTDHQVVAEAVDP